MATKLVIKQFLKIPQVIKFICQNFNKTHRDLFHKTLDILQLKNCELWHLASSAPSTITQYFLGHHVGILLALMMKDLNIYLLVLLKSAAQYYKIIIILIIITLLISLFALSYI